MKQENKILHYIWNIFFYTVIVLFLVGAGLFAFMQQQDRSVGGYRLFGVLTDSMIAPGNTLKEGGFRSGDIVITKEVDPGKLKVGDVVTFRLTPIDGQSEETNFLTHRIIKLTPQENGQIQVTTQGDANRSSDQPINADKIVGKEVFRIPAIGGWLLFIRGHLLLSLMVLVAVLALVWGITQLFSKDPSSIKET
ncbi:signal peptidase I [uncultured Enterococcus sp.]|uniref:signal peptidase I n=1 Tax=uncultured Enterococcus sp. TaxID=167972 RepID=UPI0025D18554|nr:signal peptidase I [uncultured Enterococcus sp.]